LTLYSLGALEFHAAPSRFAVQAGPNPQASPLARLQARRGDTQLTTLRHTMMDVSDDFTRGFIAGLDGARTREQIAAQIAPQFNLTADSALTPLGVLLDVLGHAPVLIA